MRHRGIRFVKTKQQEPIFFIVRTLRACARSLSLFAIETVIICYRMKQNDAKDRFLNLLNDDLNRKYEKMNGVLATFRVSSVWQYKTCHTFSLL
jgi:hypothetical protein